MTVLFKGSEPLAVAIFKFIGMNLGFSHAGAFLCVI
jgi:hypothetical protein